MSSVTGVSLNAVFPSGLVDRQQMAATQQPRSESPLFVTVGELQSSTRGENRREINPEQRQGAGQAGAGSVNGTFENIRDRTRPAVGADDSEPSSRTRESGLRESEELRQQRELARRDQEVRSHEQAHKAIAGQYAGEVRYEYARGPDGRRYAVAGSVDVDLRPAEDPQRTIEKMEKVLRAALAPSEPSSADRQIAAQANQIIQEARAEALREQQTPEQGRTSGSDSDGAPDSDAPSTEQAVAFRTSESARDSAAERRGGQADNEFGREEDSGPREDKNRTRLNAATEQRFMAVQEAIAELLRNQGGSIDEVSLGQTINFEV